MSTKTGKSSHNMSLSSVPARVTVDHIQNFIVSRIGDLRGFEVRYKEDIRDDERIKALNDYATSFAERRDNIEGLFKELSHQPGLKLAIQELIHMDRDKLNYTGMKEAKMVAGTWKEPTKESTDRKDDGRKPRKEKVFGIPAYALFVNIRAELSAEINTLKESMEGFILRDKEEESRREKEREERIRKQQLYNLPPDVEDEKKPSASHEGVNNYKVQGDWSVREYLLDDDKWDEKVSCLKESLGDCQDYLEEIHRLEQKGELIGPETDIAELEETLSVLESAIRPQAKDHFKKQFTHEELKDRIEHERQRLLRWCRKHTSSLDALQDTDEIQDFCFATCENYPIMEKNFSMLMDMAEPLLPDDELGARLLECNEVYLNLQVLLYEKMRQHLLEVHPKSKIEDEVREYANFTSCVGEFIDALYEHLTSPMDAESEAYVKPVKDKCAKLKEEFPMFTNIPQQLKDFSTRSENLREAYRSLRTAVLSKLTFFPSVVPALAASKRRKEDLVGRTKELRNWLTIKSKGATWRNIYDKIQSIAAVIDKELINLLQQQKMQEQEGVMEEGGLLPQSKVLEGFEEEESM